MRILLSGLLIILFCLQFEFLTAQKSYDVYISNSGSNNNSGTSESFPKKTISSSISILTTLAEKNDSVSLGLQSGSVFNESLITSYPIRIGTYQSGLQKNDFAEMNGAALFDSGWVKKDGTSYTFEQSIPYTGFSGYGINAIGSYSYIYVTEIDKTLINSAPFSSRKPLTFVSSLSALENTPGSFYVPVNSTENPIKVCVHPSNGFSPNENARYSYEVTVRDFAINSTYQPGNYFENLWVHGYGAGIGMLPGGSGSYYNKIIFGPGAGIHHVMVRSGTINHSLFLPAAANTSQFAVIFYDVEGLGRHCFVRNTMFLDINTPLYSHTSLGSNFGAVEMDTIVAFANSMHSGGFMYTSNTDSVLLNTIYADGYLCGYNYGNAKYASIKNSCFKNVSFGIAYSANNPVNAIADNNFIQTSSTGYTTGIYMQNNTSLQLTHSVIHINNDYKNYFPNAGAFIYGAGNTNSKISATGNIFICDIYPSATLIAATTNTDNGVATSKDTWNNNVYILLRGNAINWQVTNAATNYGSKVIHSFDDWKKQSGQDQQSLFFDLRNDPRGLQAIFTDPGNGNYDLANTPEGNQIAAMQAGMTNPLTCFLQKPSYEIAADYVLNNQVLSAFTCRNPCHQNTIRVNNTFTLQPINQRQVQLSWNISEQQNISQYEIERAIGNSVFTKIKTIPVIEDSTYTFTDDVQPGIHYQYRLVVVAKEGERCYSEIRNITISDNKAFTIYPNPSPGIIQISMNGYVGKVNFTIYNLQGQMIYSNEILNLYAPQKINLSTFPKGTYLLKSETTNGISFQKFILQ